MQLDSHSCLSDRLLSRVASVLVASTMVTAFPAVAQTGGRIGEVRDEVLVHDGADDTPQVAVDAAGQSIHVWAAPFDDEVFGLVLDAEDAALGDPLQLNITKLGDQLYPDVATQPDGSYFAIWRSNEASEWQIRGRFVDSVTGPQGSDQLLNDLSEAGASGHHGLGVAALTGGGFVAVWESFRGHGDDDDNGSTSIQGQLVDSDGSVAVTPQFQVNVTTSSWQLGPHVAPTADGGFFVVWDSANTAGNDASPYSVQGRRFTAAGAPAGGEIQVNTTTPGHQDNPRIANNSSGELLVVFESAENGALDVIRGRFLDATGTPVGDDFLVSTLTDVDQTVPDVAGGLDDFLVAWERIDGDRDILARVVVGPGEFDGLPFQVNDFDDGSQTLPAVGAYEYRAMVTWQGTNDLGGGNNSVIGRGFQLCLFCDGFESGDTTIWSLP